jgi:hypothetical protein
MTTLVDETTRHVARLGGAAAMIAAFLRVIGSFLPAAPVTTALAGLYLVTDVFILLGLIGWYVAQHQRLGLGGLFGFVMSVVGVVVIRSNGAFAGTDTYSIGAPLVVIGLLVLAATAWRAGLMGAWVPGALLVAAVLGPVGYVAPGVSVLFAASGLAFSLGFGGAGTYLWRGGAQERASLRPEEFRMTARGVARACGGCERSLMPVFQPVRDGSAPDLVLNRCPE